MLTLPIKKKWFDMILSGEKKEEYREMKPYWVKRIINNLYDVSIYTDNTIRYAMGTVILKNGYQKNAPKIKCFIELSQGFGKEEWGAEPNKLYFVFESIKCRKY